MATKTRFARYLKSSRGGHEGDLELTPFQRSLVLALRAAQEQLVEEGTIPKEFVDDWLHQQSITLPGLAHDLKRMADIGRRVARAAGDQRSMTEKR